MYACVCVCQYTYSNNYYNVTRYATTSDIIV